MTILFIILILLAILFSIFQWQKTSYSILLILFVSYFLVGSGFVPSLLLTKLQASFNTSPILHWKDKNVIVLLGNGTIKLPAPANTVKPTVLAYSRIVQTAQLYFDCIKSGNTCLIIISGGDASHTGVSEAVAYSNVLKNLRVKAEDIQLEAKSLNTFENAKFTCGLLKYIPYDKVILVTSGYHLKRALLYFSYFGIKPEPVSSDYLPSFVAVIPRSYNFVLTDIALHEYLGIIRFYVYNFFGWNKKT